MLRSHYLTLIAGILLPAVAIPFASNSAELAPAQQSIHQQERQRALEERLAPTTPDVRLSAPSASVGRITLSHPACLRYPVYTLSLSL